MAYDKAALKLMSMSDEVWIRHANPWSVRTRILLFPLWFFALWSRVWIGWWAVAPVGVMAVLTWLNPRIFRPYTDDKSWSTRGVLGERIFTRRREVQIPREHLLTAHLLSGLAGISMIAAIFGFLFEDFRLALGGWLLAATFKLWFFHRMVRLYEVMCSEVPEYRAWSRGPGAPEMK